MWGTKNHQPILSKEKRQALFQHIKENARQKEIYIDTINGYIDHVHCLVALNADMSISKAMNLVKGESSFWANKQKIFNFKLEWADEYFAVSVSESIIEQVRAYILNQEIHHKKTTFANECKEFLMKSGFEVTAKADIGISEAIPAMNGGVNITPSFRMGDNEQKN